MGRSTRGETEKLLVMLGLAARDARLFKPTMNFAVLSLCQTHSLLCAGFTLVSALTAWLLTLTSKKFAFLAEEKNIC